MHEEMVIDLFAGFGGASLAIEQALGRSPDVAINHDADAIRVHRANHPETLHQQESVWKVRPEEVAGGRRVGLLWASPDCTHYSRARGSKPVQKHIRSLAWVVIQWALRAPPRVIILENVREFEEWGPTVPRWRCQAGRKFGNKRLTRVQDARGCGWQGTEGQTVLARGRRRCPRCDSTRLIQTEDQIPDPKRKGITFRRFVGRLRGLGYAVEWRTLNAADFGAPTHRRRLFLVARRDGLPIVWPAPTHGDPAKLDDAPLFAEPLQAWRTAAECLDWSIECPSIFLTPAEARAWAKARGCAAPKRPLEEMTLRRIALGVRRYVLENPRPFIVVNTTGNRPTSTAEPLKTATTGNHHYLAVPHLVQCNHGGPEFRGQAPDRPLCTVCASRDAHGIVAPLLCRISQSGGNGKYANDMREPLTTVVSKAEHLLIAPTLIQTGYGERHGQAPRVLDLGGPLGTVVAGGCKAGLVAAFLAKHFGGVIGQPAETPASTVTARDHHSVVTANLIRFNHDDAGVPVDAPSPTVTAHGCHAGLVYSFLTKYNRTGRAVGIDEPLHTAPAHDRFGLVVVLVNGEPHVIVDIGMRMLSPRELARCQGFGDDYLLPSDQLPGTKSCAVELIGNSVSPPPAVAILRANLGAPVLEEVAC